MRRIVVFLSALLCAALLLTPAVSAESMVRPLGAQPDFLVNADAVLLLDCATGEALFERGADQRVYPASTTKIMTALCAVNAVADLDNTVVTVRDEVLSQLPDDDNTLAWLQVGEQLTMRQLLYCLLLPSGNDAALVIADYVGQGSVAAFAELMNSTAGSLGCTGTHFVSPHGLNGEEQYTTARDMARMAQALLQNPTLAEIVGTPTYILNTNVHEEEPYTNTNILIDPESEYYHPAVTGIKTGFTTLAGRCFVASAEQNGLSLLCVVMGAPVYDNQGDVISPSPAITGARALFEWAFTSFSRVTLADGETPFTATVERTEVTVRPAEEITVLLPTDKAAEVARIVDVPQELCAPLEAGTAIGEIRFLYGDEVVASTLLLLTEDVAAPFPWHWLILGVGVALILLFFLLRTAVRRRKRAARRRARQRAATLAAEEGRIPVSSALPRR